MADGNIEIKVDIGIDKSDIKDAGELFAKAYAVVYDKLGANAAKAFGDAFVAENFHTVEEASKFVDSYVAKLKNTNDDAKSEYALLIDRQRELRAALATGESGSGYLSSEAVRDYANRLEEVNARIAQIKKTGENLLPDVNKNSIDALKEHIKNLQAIADSGVDSQGNIVDDLSNINKELARAKQELAEMKQAQADALAPAIPEDSYAKLIQQISRLKRELSSGISSDGVVLSKEDVKESEILLDKLQKQLADIRKTEPEPVIPEDSIAHLEMRLGKLQKVWKTGLSPTGMALTDKQLESTYNHMVQLQDKISELRKAMTEPPEIDLSNVDTSYVDLLNHMKELQQMIKTGLTEGGEVVPPETIAELRKELEKVKHELAEIRGEEPTRLQQMWQHLGDTVRSVFEKSGKAVTWVGTKIKKHLSNGFKQVGKTCATVQEKLSRGFKNIGKAGVNAVNKTNKSFKRGLITALKYGFGVRGLFMLFRNLRSVATDSLKAIATQFSGSQFGNDFQQFINLTAQLKASFGTMLQPIAAVVIPILNTLMSALNDAMNAVARFFAVLSGQGVIYKAAAAEKELGEATGGAGKEAEGALGAYDKLNVIQSNTGGGGGGSSGGAATYTEETIDATNTFAEKVKQAWVDSDFTEIGQIIGQKVIEGLTTLEETVIPWFNEFIPKITSSITTLINGFFGTDGIGSRLGTVASELVNILSTAYNDIMYGIDWGQLGSFLADTLSGLFTNVDFASLTESLLAGYHALWETAEGFFTELDTASIGENFSNGLITAVNTFDAKEAASTFGNTIAGFFDRISDFFQNVDWRELLNGALEKLKTFISEVDWVGIVESIATSLGSIAGSLGVLVDIIWQNLQLVWQEVMDYFKSFIGEGSDDEEWYEAGARIIEGVFNGIIECLKNIGTWINDHIFKPFMGAFKNVFEIHSPSKAMEEIGGFIGEGLLHGISSWISSITQVATNIWNGIKSVFSTVTTWFSTTFTIALTKIKSVFNWENIKSTFTKIWDGIKGVFNSVGEWFGNTFEDAWTKVKNVFSSGGEIFSGIKEGIETTFKTIVNKLISGINTIIKKPFEKINSMLNTIRNTEVLGAKPFSSLWAQNPLSIPSIPKLAQGAVIPPNRKFLAMLGDQTHGTNIEAPLDTIKQALVEALSESGSKQPIVLQLSGKTVAQVVWDETNKKYKQTGIKSFAY